MWPRLGPVDRQAFVTRVPIVLLATILMAFVYRWARDLFGHWGGVLAVVAMAWDPTMIAHSQLSTTDLGVTLFGFACLFCVRRVMSAHSDEIVHEFRSCRPPVGAKRR